MPLHLDPAMKKNNSGWISAITYVQFPDESLLLGDDFNGHVGKILDGGGVTATMGWSPREKDF